MKKYIIIKKKDNEDPENNTNEFWGNKDYVEYKKKNGMHFSDKLAEWASKRMKNANGMEHTWSVADVQGAYKALGLKLPEGATWGDATYAANMMYADLGPELKADTDAVKYGHRLISDPDAYEGQLFNRYTADVMEANIPVPWEMFAKKYE